MGSSPYFHPHPLGPWTVAHWNPTDIIRLALTWDGVKLVSPGLLILTPLPLSGTSLGGLSGLVGEGECGKLWRLLDIFHSERQKW